MEGAGIMVHLLGPPGHQVRTEPGVELGSGVSEWEEGAGMGVTQAGAQVRQEEETVYFQVTRRYWSPITDLCGLLNALSSWLLRGLRPLDVTVVCREGPLFPQPEGSP